MRSRKKILQTLEQFYGDVQEKKTEKEKKRPNHWTVGRK